MEKADELVHLDHPLVLTPAVLFVGFGHLELDLELQQYSMCRSLLPALYVMAK